MAAGGELCGFLDVKVPARVRRRRGLAPWKAWKKQWIVVRRSQDGSPAAVEVQLGTSSGGSCIRVPIHSIVYRTESRSRQFAFGVFSATEPRRPAIFLAGGCETESQRWMAHIRDLLRPPATALTTHVEGGYAISFIDNAHSRAAGLSGVYGTLVVGPSRLALLDPCTGQVICSWRWHQLHQFHLAVTDIPDDENKICVIHTSSEFCAGAGQLYLYCVRATELLERLLASGRVRRLLSSPLPSPPLPLRRWARRLSRSESDLHCFSTESAPGSRCVHVHKLKAPLERSQSSSRTSATSDDYVQVVGGKVATSLISAGLGLLFSTPACSEADTESLHEYQTVDDDSDEAEDSTEHLFDSTDAHQYRRESGVSIASGIYEEIDEDALPNGNTNHYENPASLLWPGPSVVEDDSPPPLPPRKLRQHFLDSHESYMDELAAAWCYRKPITRQHTIPIPTSQPSLRQHECSASCSPDFRSSWLPPHRQLQDEEPDYLPMSPGYLRPAAAPTVPTEEQHYIVMASVTPT